MGEDNYRIAVFGFGPSREYHPKRPGYFSGAVNLDGASLEGTKEIALSALQRSLAEGFRVSVVGRGV